MENDFHKRYKNYRTTGVSSIFFIPTCRELNSLSLYVVCGLWLHVMQVDVYGRLKIGLVVIITI